MLRNKQQNKTLHGLLNELRIDEETKEQLVYDFTSKRETSSSKMLVNECQALINHLIMMKNQTSKSVKTQLDNSPENKMRRKVLSVFHEMNWKNGSGLDWNRINNWMDKFSYLHKPLNNYTKEELPKLITQVEQILKSQYAKG
ncbi:MAG: hypothetical protein JNK73_13050 [Bacteroidia bacterium]|nr:hypothetical protein [Bacteroidia bacterium]